MGRIKSKQRVIAYSKNFKIKAVKLSYLKKVQALEIAKVLGLHPFMLYRWRKEYKDGKLVADNDRHVTVTMTGSKETRDRPKPKPEIERLKAENARLKKEVDTLKKWQRYLKEARKNDLDL